MKTEMLNQVQHDEQDFLVSLLGKLTRGEKVGDIDDQKEIAYIIR